MRQDRRWSFFLFHPRPSHPRISHALLINEHLVHLKRQLADDMPNERHYVCLMEFEILIAIWVVCSFISIMILTCVHSRISGFLSRLISSHDIPVLKSISRICWNRHVVILYFRSPGRSWPWRNGLKGHVAFLDVNLLYLGQQPLYRHSKPSFSRNLESGEVEIRLQRLQNTPPESNLIWNNLSKISCSGFFVRSLNSKFVVTL